MRIDGNLPIAKFAADLSGAMAIFEALGLDYLPLLRRPSRYWDSALALVAHGTIDYREASS